MKDRVPKYPGRVKMTLPDGTSQFVTLERADEPTETGTPLNKSTLLKDATAQLLGIGGLSDPTVDDAFAAVNDALSSLRSSLTDAAKTITGSYIGTGTYGSDNKNTIVFSSAPKILFIFQKDYYMYCNACAMFLNGVPRAFGMYYNDKLAPKLLLYLNVIWDQSSVRWWSADYYYYQLNTADIEYLYLAIY